MPTPDKIDEPLTEPRMRPRPLSAVDFSAPAKCSLAPGLFKTRGAQPLQQIVDLTNFVRRKADLTGLVDYAPNDAGAALK